MALLSAGLYYLGIRKRRNKPEKIYSNETIFFLGVIATAASIAYLGKVIDAGWSGHFSLLLLLAAIIYGLLGLWFPSTLIWIFSLLSLGAWVGAETGYASWGADYLGMSYPLRFVLFGIVLLVVSTYIFGQWTNRANFLAPSRAIGLLCLFVALWIMSIFGNYETYLWQQARHIELLPWSLLFAGVAIASIYHGVKYDDDMTRGFGMTFILINLYTRYFEYFWEGTHKTIFFAILAISFWYLGSRA